MNTSVNRLNQIYENEFATRLVIINENDKLIHLDGASDPYSTPEQGRKLLGQNNDVVNQLLGSSSKFDIGHVFTIACTDGVGGIASLASICSESKGAGVTCFYSSLLVITVEVTAHEMGHQFSASHTFNVCQGDSQNAGENGYEPGGGSTIMSYGQLCGINSFVGQPDDYYHNGSLQQIYDRLRSPVGGAYECANKVPINNHAPTVKINFTKGTSIPKSTPFILEGSGSDEDGDKLTFNWEGKDASTTLCPLGQPSGTCPLFRSVAPDTFGYRIIPSPTKLLSGQSSGDEVLATYARKTKFSLTARDNNPEGGYATWVETELNVDGNSGSFHCHQPQFRRKLPGRSSNHGQVGCCQYGQKHRSIANWWTFTFLKKVVFTQPIKM